ncbi:MAG: D-ribose pyranase [Clostridia bacterium]|nr:D-ribose pyranase [Clostridia bacterium]
MRKGVLLNSNIMQTISKMGHKDKLIIANAGLPIPKNVERIDLALKEGVPSFIETLDVVLLELEVECIILAEEIKEMNPDIWDEIVERFEKSKIRYVPHEELKTISQSAKAVVRTGECSPYANIILEAGIIF